MAKNIIENIRKNWAMIVFLIGFFISIIIFYAQTRELPGKVNCNTNDIKTLQVDVKKNSNDIETLKKTLDSQFSEIKAEQKSFLAQVNEFIKDVNKNQQEILRALGRLEGYNLKKEDGK